MSEACLHRVFPPCARPIPAKWVAMIEAAQAMEIDVDIPGHDFVDLPRLLAKRRDSPKIQPYRAIKQTQEALAKKNPDGNAVRLDSFIVSVTPREHLQELWNRREPAWYVARNIVF